MQRYDARFPARPLGASPWLAATALLSAWLMAGCGGCNEPASPGTKTIATLAASRGEVKLRRAGSLTWHSIVAGTALAARDAIKTGNGSRATLRFADGSKLELQAKTLIIVEAPAPLAGAKASSPKSAAARLERGEVRGAVAAGGALELSRPGGKQTRITAGASGAKVRIRAREDGSLRIANLGGSATVRSAKQEVRLATRQGIALGGAQTEAPLGAPRQLPAYPQLLSPAVDAELTTDALTLRWQPSPGAARYRLQLARSTSFDDLQREAFVDGTEHVLTKLPPGSYVWRVSATNAAGFEGEFGFARRLTVRAPEPRPMTAVLSPKAPTVMASKRRRAQVLFRWRAVPKVKRYRLVVAKDAALRRVVSSDEGETTERRLTLPVGRLFWRVFDADATPTRALLSQPQKLQVLRYRPPRVKIPKSIGRWR